MRNNTKKLFLLTFSILISVVMIFLVLRSLDIALISKTIKLLGYGNILIATSIYMSSFIFRGIRWKVMLATNKEVPAKLCTQIVVLGYAANNLLPFRMGELVRAFIMSKKENLSKTFCLSTVFIERLIDGITLVTILILSMLMLSDITLQSKLFSKIHNFSLIFLLIMSVFYSLFVISSNKLDILIEKIPGIKIRALLRQINEALGIIKLTGDLIRVLILSLLIWGIEGLVFVYILNAIGINNAVLIGFFCLGVLNLGILLPSAPGYIGVFQASVVLAFTALGLNPSLGLAFGIILHLIQYTSVSLVGILIFQFVGISSRVLYEQNK